MNRREFSALLGGAAVSAAASPLAGAAQANSAEISARARELYRRALILDANSGPPFEGHLPLPLSDLDLVRDSGIDVIKLSLGGINSDFAATVAEIAQVQQLIEVHPAYFTQVRVAADMARAKRDRQ